MTKRWIISTIAVLTTVGLFQNCQPAHFAKNDTGTVNAACTSGDIEDIHRLTKILFVVDQSGSNASWTDSLGTYACVQGSSGCTNAPTDPTKSFRAGVIQNFFSLYQHKTNFQWGFSTFAYDAAHALINSGNDQSPYYTTTVSQMQSAITTFQSRSDNGATPYKAAIRLATKAIQLDRDVNSASHPQYFVILLSDGFPTDYLDGNGNSFDASLFNSDINSLLASSPGNVNLSAIYYGAANNPSAVELLKAMASMGNGQFANVNVSGSGIKIEDVIPGSACN